MFQLAMFGVLATMGLALARALKGPTVFDRILAVNMFGTATVLLICVAGFSMGMQTTQGEVIAASRPEFVDLALVYALVNFAGTIAVLKFVRFGNLASDDSRAQR
jgi:multicomponent Na+:H+ antiporter subunit F